ncbi:MAG: hypothetical protein K2P33_04670, partial [Acutalibacter sp.]|nr:hypothetical protein [Acutalibacter sp.]
TPSFYPEAAISCVENPRNTQVFLAVFSLKALVFGHKSDISPVFKQTLDRDGFCGKILFNRRLCTVGLPQFLLRAASFADCNAGADMSRLLCGSTGALGEAGGHPNPPL